MNHAEMKNLQAGDLEYKEANTSAAVRNRLEVDGVKTEQNAAMLQVHWTRYFLLCLDEISWLCWYGNVAKARVKSLRE